MRIDARARAHGPYLVPEIRSEGPMWPGQFVGVPGRGLAGKGVMRQGEGGEHWRFDVQTDRAR